MRQEKAPRSTARKVSLALLIVLLLGQALVVLATIVVAGLGGASAGQAAILFGGVGAASVLLLVLLAGTIRGTSKPVTTIWALAAPLLDVAAFAIVPNVVGGPGACNEGEATALTPSPRRRASSCRASRGTARASARRHSLLPSRSKMS